MVELLLLVLIVVVLGGALLWWRRERAAREARNLADVRADARRWYERLGGQVMNLSGEDPAARQALADAAERYHAAGSQLEQAGSITQYRLARETAVEGLTYIRAARLALGIDPGPPLPPLAAASGAGELTVPRQVEVQGQTFQAGPQPGQDTPYYYPGGRVRGRPVPAGWYSTPWWKTAFGAGVGVLGGMLIADALFSPSFGDPGYDAAAAGGFDDPGDAGADFGGGDFGGGDFGGGDFGGGDF
ncbi:hypothetical protein [Verrucosispora sp. WMMA2121]|uniref:hypothetical protein n=1 Tax=Verrucosispora sp. WMMA2121 TaxID=3015164 RepID=UPI003FCE31E8